MSEEIVQKYLTIFVISLQTYVDLFGKSVENAGIPDDRTVSRPTHCGRSGINEMSPPHNCRRDGTNLQRKAHFTIIIRQPYHLKSVTGNSHSVEKIAMAAAAEHNYGPDVHVSLLLAVADKYPDIFCRKDISHGWHIPNRNANLVYFYSQLLPRLFAWRFPCYPYFAFLLHPGRYLFYHWICNIFIFYMQNWRFL